MTPSASGEDRDPERVAAQAFRALTEGRWSHVVSLIDPADVERFREEKIRGAAHPPDFSSITAETILRHEPEMPAEVAAYQAERMRGSGVDWESRLLAEFGVASTDELEVLAATELLARYFEKRHPAAQMRAALAGREDQIPEDYPLELMLGPRFEVLGSVPEGDALAHVVYRMRLGAAPDDPGAEDESYAPLFVKVATLKRTPAGWRLRLTYDLFGVESLSVGVDVEERSPEP